MHSWSWSTSLGLPRRPEQKRNKTVSLSRARGGGGGGGVLYNFSSYAYHPWFWCATMQCMLNDSATYERYPVPDVVCVDML